MNNVESFWVGKFVRIQDPSGPQLAHAGERGQVVSALPHSTLLILRYADGSHTSAGMAVVVLDQDQVTPVWPQQERAQEELPPMYIVASPLAVESGANGTRLLDGERFQGLSWSAAREALGILQHEKGTEDLRIFQCAPIKDQGWWVVVSEAP